MENLADYSNYVNAAYIVAGFLLVGFAGITVVKYLRLRKHVQK